MGAGAGGAAGGEKRTETVTMRTEVEGEGRGWGAPSSEGVPTSLADTSDVTRTGVWRGRGGGHLLCSRTWHGRVGL